MVGMHNPWESHIFLALNLKLNAPKSKISVCDMQAHWLGGRFYTLSGCAMPGEIGLAVHHLKPYAKAIMAHLCQKTGLQTDIRWAQKRHAKPAWVLVHHSHASASDAQ